MPVFSNKLIWLAAIVGVLFVSIALYDPDAPGRISSRHVEKAKAAQSRGDEATALKYYQLTADAGFAQAQFELAKMYYAGAGGVRRDYKVAFGWAEKAAAQRHADARNMVGIMVHKGQGTKRDLHGALSHFLLAAKQGHTEAKLNAGDVYLALSRKGEEVDFDAVYAILKTVRGTKKQKLQAERLISFLPAKKWWAMAARPRGMGHATGIGNTSEQAYQNAIAKCNAGKFHNVNSPGRPRCTGVISLPLNRQGCGSVITGFVASNTFTAHFGTAVKRYRVEAWRPKPPDPRRESRDRAYENCRATYRSYGATACRGRSVAGISGNATFCTSGILGTYKLEPY